MMIKAETCRVSAFLFQINDRTSFKDFLGLSSGDKVPDSRTIWLFRERLIDNGLGEILFHDFVNT